MNTPLTDLQLEYKLEWLIKDCIIEKILENGKEDDLILLKMDIYDVVITLILKEDFRKDNIIPKLKEIYTRINVNFIPFPL